MSHWGNPFGYPLRAGIHPGALSWLESMLVPKAQLMTYQDGFYLVALFFFASVAPAWLMRGRRPRRTVSLKAEKPALTR